MEIQKKWFIYVGDHHEGPFTPKEIFEKLKANPNNPEDNFVWCEGMGDWQPLPQVNELNQEVQKLKQQNLEKQNESKSDPASASEKTGVYQINPKPASNKSKTKNSKKSMVIFFASLIGLVLIGFGSLAAMSRSNSEEFHATLRPTLHKVVNQFPFLSNLFKLVPSLNDVKPDELKELEAATLGAPDANVKIAFALSQSDPNRPFFYISSNLPNKTKFDVYLIGNRETLLNKLQYNTQSTSVLNVGFGRTEVILAEGGQPLPKGEYQVVVTEASEQDDSIKNELTNYPSNRANLSLPPQIPAGVHFLFSKNYFIGGERDQTYLTRLKAFHEKIKQNAEKEITELKQYSDTLYSQFNTFTGDFNKIYSSKKPTPAMKLNWKKNSETWMQINSQLEQTIQTWTKETLQNEFFYGPVYEMVKSSYESMKKLYQLESNYLDSPGDKNAFEIQHGKVLSESRDANELLKSKVEMIFKAPISPSGLPTREGL